MRSAHAELLPGVPTQLIALALLVVVLFPVISLTDDLAMCAATAAETEHALRPQKLDDVDHHAPNPAFAMLASFGWLEQALPALPTVNGAEDWDEPVHPSAGVSLSIESRPPPAFA